MKKPLNKYCYIVHFIDIQALTSLEGFRYVPIQLLPRFSDLTMEPYTMFFDPFDEPEIIQIVSNISNYIPKCVCLKIELHFPYVLSIRKVELNDPSLSNLQSIMLTRLRVCVIDIRISYYYQ